MPDQQQFEQGLRRILWALRDYLDDLMVIGGWVPHLYRRYGGFAEWRSDLSRTAEVDVLVPATLVPGGRPLVSALLHDAGFRPATEGNSAAVWENDPATGERIEFLVQHQGTARQIGRPRSLLGQERLAAIPLTDMDLMMRHTTTLHIPVTIASGESVLAVRVPTLGAYIATKATTFAKRQPVLVEGRASTNPKAAKD